MIDLTVIPDDCLIVIKAPESEHDALAYAFGMFNQTLSERGITGLICTDKAELTFLDDLDLAHLGLRRMKTFKRKGK